jgi:hypothetical protein
MKPFAVGKASATVLEQRVSAATRLNKDGHLIRLDYVLPKLCLAARSNIISLIRTPRRLFIFLIATSRRHFFGQCA